MLLSVSNSGSSHHLDFPASLIGIVVMSSILHQVFKLNTNTVILGNVTKLYVSTIKKMCQEFLTDPGLDKVCRVMYDQRVGDLNSLGRPYVTHLSILYQTLLNNNMEILTRVDQLNVPLLINGFIFHRVYLVTS